MLALSFFLHAYNKITHCAIKTTVIVIYIKCNLYYVICDTKYGLELCKYINSNFIFGSRIEMRIRCKPIQFLIRS